MASPAASLDPALAMTTGATPLADWLVVVPIALPLLAAGVTLALRHQDRLQVNAALLSLALLVAANAALLWRVAADGPVVMTMGNWLPPFGISITVDLLSGVLLLVTALVGLAGGLFATVDIDEGRRRYGFYTFYLLLIAGVSGAFSTGDIFNLYVWFEVFLIASFGLLILGGERPQLDGAVKYGILNFLATTFFLVAIAYLYGLVGTLNIADIRSKVAILPDAAPIAGVTALFVLAFAMKAAAFPVHAWLPASYHVPRITVAAVFGGLLTKVGIYGLLRIVVMLTPAAAAGLQPVLAWIAGLTAIVGALCALAEGNVRRMLGFLVVSSIGLMLIGVALGSEAALSGAILYVVHSILATTALYLVVGAIERAAGVEVADIASGAGAGIFRRHALLAGLFLVFAFALAGLPPFSGVWPKVVLIEASLSAGSPALAAVVVANGLLTTLALGRVWLLLVLRDRPDGLRPAPAPAAAPNDGPDLPTLALAGLAVAVVALGVYPEPMVRAAEAGAATLLDPAPYVDAVIGGNAE